MATTRLTPAILASPPLASEVVVRARLAEAGLRPTRQRMQLGSLLFGEKCRHITAEMLFIEARDAGATLTLATVYNTLSQFCEAGLLRQLHTGHSCAVYDTDVTCHHHCVVGFNGPIFDMPVESLQFVSPPVAPPGYRIAGINIVIQLEPDGEKVPACADIAP